MQEADSTEADSISSQDGAERFAEGSAVHGFLEDHELLDLEGEVYNVIYNSKPRDYRARLLIVGVPERYVESLMAVIDLDLE